jgi:hypothetical protein
MSLSGLTTHTTPGERQCNFLLISRCAADFPNYRCGAVLEVAHEPLQNSFRNRGDLPETTAEKVALSSPRRLTVKLRGRPSAPAKRRGTLH